MADLTKMAGVLAGPQGVLSQYMGAAPTYAQKAMNFLGGIPGALYALTKGDTYGTDPNSPVADLAKERLWRGSVFGAPEDVKQRNIQNALAVAMAAPTVYHGSPHKFDKFDPSKIGTGEGSQAYGHGIYLADNPKVADSYKASNAISSGTPDGYAAGIVGMYGGEHKALNYLKAILPQKGQTTFNGESHEFIRDAISSIENGTHKNILGGGSLYKVDLPDAMAAKMLDWDKPLSQQAPEVQKAVGAGVFFDPALTGKEIYQQIASEGFKKNGAGANHSEYATQFFKKLGVPGIRYLDQGSRGAGQGTYNYVAFPGTEDALKILERK